MNIRFVEDILIPIAMLGMIVILCIVFYEMAGVSQPHSRLDKYEILYNECLHHRNLSPYQCHTIATEAIN